jgi:DNA-binding NarL/FixJ family response regulator
MFAPASEDEATIENLLRRRTAVRHILQLRLQGKSRKQIAVILGKSPHTIDWHLRELMRSCRALSLARIVVIIAASPRLTALLSSADSPPPESGG